MQGEGNILNTYMSNFGRRKNVSLYHAHIFSSVLRSISSLIDTIIFLALATEPNPSTPK